MHSWYGVEKFDIEDQTGSETSVPVSNLPVDIGTDGI